MNDENEKDALILIGILLLNCMRLKKKHVVFILLLCRVFYISFSEFEY
jgi:hypothetical protein